MDDDDAIDWAEVLLKRTFTKGRAKGGVGGQTIDEMMRGTFHEVSAFELEGAALEITALRARLEAVEGERDEQRHLRDHQCHLKLEAIARAERAEAALATARRDALLEAAKVAETAKAVCARCNSPEDNHPYRHPFVPVVMVNIPAAIRALAYEAET